MSDRSLERSTGETEADRIETWRLGVLLEAGYPADLAGKIARRWHGVDAIDLHHATQLVVDGCPPHVAAAIVL